MAKQVNSSVTQSRGEDARNYMPALKKGAQILSASIGGLWLSGTIVSGRIVVAVNHGRGVKPKSVVVSPLLTGAQGASAVAITVSLAAASASTSANIFLIGSQKTNGAIGYAAYLQF